MDDLPRWLLVLAVALGLLVGLTGWLGLLEVFLPVLILIAIIAGLIGAVVAAFRGR